MTDPQLRQLIAAIWTRTIFFSVPEDNPLKDFLQTVDEAASPDSDPKQAALAFICKRLKLNLKKQAKSAGGVA